MPVDEYAPLDAALGEKIASGDLNAVLQDAWGQPGRVGRVLGNYRHVLGQWVKEDPDKTRELLTLTWHRLDEETKRQFIRLLSQKIMQVARTFAFSFRNPVGKLKINPFKFQSDELELEATVEKIIGRTWFGYEDLTVLDAPTLWPGCSPGFTFWLCEAEALKIARN